MSFHQLQESPPFSSARHPLTAAALSLVPGLGQLYVGDRRKGILFLNVAFANAVIIGLCLWCNQIHQLLSAFASDYHMRVNQDTSNALVHLAFGSPASITILIMSLLFVFLCARDAYDQAFGQRKPIYKDALCDLSESSSASYLAHFALFATMAIMAVFFVMSPPKVVQSVHVFVFTDEKKPVEKPQVTQNVASKATAMHGRTSAQDNRRQTPQEAATKHPAEAKPTAAAARPTPAAARPTPTAPAPRAVPTPTPVRAPMPTPIAAPRPVPVPRATAQMTDAPPSPTKAPNTNVLAMLPQLPQAPSARANLGVGETPMLPHPAAASSVVAGIPGPTRLHIGGSTSGVPGPAAPASNSHSMGVPGPGVAVPSFSAGHSTSDVPAPVSVNLKRGPGGLGDSTAPAPVKAGGSHTGPSGDGIAVGPSLSPARPSVGGTPGDGSGVRSRTNDGDSPPANASPNFDKYMAELQRRIRRHWFPPKDPLSKVAVVTFVVARDGTMTGLRLSRRTGNELSDQAALRAVEDAAPFPPLPAGSPPTVDIEFTFTYQVYGNDGTSFRRL